ncbi:activator of HSP90 ATPase [Kordiimonas sediminis]|uniref:Activator of HSP90 ATPase n=1 Tax=Kordiimonas sediminis TaxID=1735581 RepID=A0A919E711_9PROT|nr:SRPBCC domain-containing protein [Kordiimonas sediminis]GHF20371.1 activator of HSP90 ATPase [Kordiimonas sediminis]
MTAAMKAKDLTTEPVLEIVRTFNTSPEQLFKAFTDPLIIKKWWGPDTMETTVSEIDLREGGAWRTVMTAETGESYDVAGVYKKIDPPHQLIFTWAWLQGANRGEETTVELTFTDKGDKTELYLRQGSFADGCQEHYEGWTSGLDNLAKLY